MMGIERQWEAKPPPRSCRLPHWKTKYLNLSQEPSRPKLLPSTRQGVGPKISVKETSAASLPWAIDSPEPDAVIA